MRGGSVLSQKCYSLLFHPIGGDAVAVVGIVVVHRPVRVHVANIVTVAGVGSPQPPVGSRRQHTESRSYNDYPVETTLLYE